MACQWTLCMNHENHHNLIQCSSLHEIAVVHSSLNDLERDIFYAIIQRAIHGCLPAFCEWLICRQMFQHEEF